PFRVSATARAEQILPVPFADICAQTMVPFSHVLWSACWLGIATDAVRRARLYVRARVGSGSGADRRLADAVAMLHQMQATVFHTARTFDDVKDEERSALGLAITMNELKLIASDLVVRIVSLALSICGIGGYMND